MTGGEPDDGRGPGRVVHRPVGGPEPPDDGVRGVGRILSARRVLVSLAAGLGAGAVVGLAGASELVPLVTWTVAATVVLVWAWRISWPLDHRGTKLLAEAESRSRSSDAAVLVGAVVSLGAVALALARSGSDRDPVAVALVILSVLAVVLAWGLVNTVFALKYARLYYKDEVGADGGIDFKQERPPAYSDFAYLAFTVGMACAVPEAEPTSTEVRKTALGHALLSYAFGTGVLAVAVNLVTDLGPR
ncbi:DUF1345 domain-containing protein [Pseudonocardia hydrocarbonoxydans]|uniref:DUF1345 domain-containing protein n=1 Tax=Pseudonocardia hydrocarbonoxydans TaxID=76726 RepID=A0A4Y3WQM3_9PSEU|nr:DUF1345 domain-containing protein [Pseudonocardia hydrocarbonoxydans]GEC21135.1 hypothetical protein PHY01_34180 [Pseudonocardia hydrocarbonoxydans]